MKLVWDENAWEDYLWWQAQDRRVVKRINVLIEDVTRNGNTGIGKPEPLLMEEAARAAGRDPKEAIVIGDGIVTDLAAANAVGARTILMLTGVTTGAALEALPSTEAPFAVAADATELAQVLETLSAA